MSEQKYQSRRIMAGLYIVPTNDARRLAWVMRCREDSLVRRDGSPIAPHDAWEYGYIPERYIDRNATTGEMNLGRLLRIEDPISAMINDGPHGVGYRTKKAALLDAVKETG